MVTTAVAVRPGLADRPRPLLEGYALATGGLILLSRIGMHGSYADGLLGPMLVAAVGFGPLLVPLNMTGLSRIHDAESESPSACLPPASKSVRRSAWPPWVPLPGPSSPTGSGQKSQTPRPRRPGPDTRPPEPTAGKSMIRPWPPGSRADSWSRRAPSGSP
jgi:hypothetical protein